MPSDIEAFIRRYAEKIDAVLEQSLGAARGRFISEPLRHHFSSGGKRIRPALCLYICESLGGQVEEAVHFAVAVELLHNMFLVHDDVEDGDRSRRDLPTVWVKYGVPNAINVGDYLMAEAHKIIAAGPNTDGVKVRLLNIFSDVAKRTIEGQALDINLRASEDFTVDSYMEIARMKTGHYLVVGMAGGAIIASAEDGVIESLWALGESLGPAFQIRDDVIDLTAGKGRSGEKGCDIKEGKPSILFAHCLSHAEAGDRAALLDVIARPREQTTDADVQRVMALYEKSGSLEFARGYAGELIDRAFAVIDGIPIADKQPFRDIAQFLADRTS